MSEKSEEREAALDRKIAEMRRRNEQIARRRAEVEEDRKNANEVSRIAGLKDEEKQSSPPQKSPNSSKSAEKVSPRGRGGHRGRASKNLAPVPSPRMQNRISSEEEGVVPPPEPKYGFLSDDPSRVGSDPNTPPSREFRSPRGRGAGWLPGETGGGMSGSGGFDERSDGYLTKREMEMRMTGRERRDYQEWREERENIDRQRLARSQNIAGQWTREWDIDKPNQMDEPRSPTETSRGGYSGQRARGRGYRGRGGQWTNEREFGRPSANETNEINKHFNQPGPEHEQQRRIFADGGSIRVSVANIGENEKEDVGAFGVDNLHNKGGAKYERGDRVKPPHAAGRGFGSQPAANLHTTGLPGPEEAGGFSFAHVIDARPGDSTRRGAWPQAESWVASDSVTSPNWEQDSSQVQPRPAQQGRDRPTRSNENAVTKTVAESDYWPAEDDDQWEDVEEEEGDVIVMPEDKLREDGTGPEVVAGSGRVRSTESEDSLVGARTRQESMDRIEQEMIEKMKENIEAVEAALDRSEDELDGILHEEKGGDEKLTKDDSLEEDNFGTPAPEEPEEEFQDAPDLPEQTSESEKMKENYAKKAPVEKCLDAVVSKLSATEISSADEWE